MSITTDRAAAPRAVPEPTRRTRLAAEGVMAGYIHDMARLVRSHRGGRGHQPVRARLAAEQDPDARGGVGCARG